MSEAGKTSLTGLNEAPDYHAELRVLNRKRDRGAPRLLTMLIFVGLGPLIGGFVFFTPVLWNLATSLTSGFPGSFHLAPTAIVIILIGSYVLGGFPAFLAGAVVLMARRILPRHPVGRGLAFGLIGGLDTVVFVFISRFVFQETRDDGTIVITPFFHNLHEFLISASTCIVPTLICGYIASRAGWLTPPQALKEPGK